LTRDLTKGSSEAFGLVNTEKGCFMVSLQYDLSSDSESEAFFGAFFKFVEAASVADTDSISIHSDTKDGNVVRIVNFEDETLADRFQIYWTQRRKWLGL
jgi:hypothetical protein